VGWITGKEGTSKLACLILPLEDLLDLEAIEWAKRAVLELVIEPRCEVATVVGVECIGEDRMWSCAGPWESPSSWSESSKEGMGGKEGMSLCSIASIRRHIREGVSSTVAIPEEETWLKSCDRVYF
jgi:hypothetical protein